jgi:dihydrofolate reductase
MRHRTEDQILEVDQQHDIAASDSLTGRDREGACAAARPRPPTYVQSKGYWPCAEEQGEYGEKLNNLKFVASSRLDDAPWGDFPAATVTRDPVATIRELKEQSGMDLWLWGSLKLMYSLLDVGVVDEVRMLVCPASRGKGTRIFEDRQDLKLVEATSFENGLALLRYEINK